MEMKFMKLFMNFPKKELKEYETYVPIITFDKACVECGLLANSPGLHG
jgi:hypothetical protein